MGEERNTELGELLEDTGISPEDYVIHSTLATEMERLLAELTPQQQEVLILHFGLLDGKSLTLDKIAPRLNLSRERVRQIKQKALVQLRTIAETGLIVSTPH